MVRWVQSRVSKEWPASRGVGDKKEKSEQVIVFAISRFLSLF